ncbi:MAG: dihydrolipoamide acetyltransferase family protein [Acidimicrobiia bacterium]
MDVTMPQLGETVTEGTITKWIKKVGDSVSADETLFEVSTDKVDSEVPSPAAGVLSEILVNEGDTAAVGAKLAVISDSGAAPISKDSADAVEDVSKLASAAQAETAGSAGAEGREAASGETNSNAAPESSAADTTDVQAASAGTNTAGKLLSPIVRKLINENGLDANTITGTGLGGRITRDDVNAAISSRGAGIDVSKLASVAQAETTGSAGAEGREVASGETSTAARPAPSAIPSSGDSVIPFDNMRRRTAEHMVMSRHTSPHAYISVEVDFENIERVRRNFGPAFKEREGFSLTYLPFIVRALSEVLPEFPNVNASVDGDNLIVHHDFHVGIAVDLDHKGLLVPAVRNADGKRLKLIAQEIRDLAVRARSKKLQPEEIIGSTFTITNPGPYGSYQTFPIINQPQVAILATDGVSKKPVVVQDEYGQDVIAVHHMGMLTLGWDHISDGGYTYHLAHSAEVLETRLEFEIV